MNTYQVHQDHTDGQKVFCFSQAMLGCGSQVWGTVKECKKYKWVILDKSTQERVRYDRAYWYTKEQWDAENEFVSEMHRQDKEKAIQQKEKLNKEINEITSTLSPAIIAIGNKVKVVSKYVSGMEFAMEFVYEITDISNNGTIFGKEILNGIASQVECSVGNVNGDYFAV